MSLSEMAFGKLIQRFFLYVGLALVALAVLALIVVLTHGASVPSRWVALIVYTFGLFWVAIRQSREYWQYAAFWLAIFGLLVIHSLAFVAVLRGYPQWRGIWFMPIVIGEGGLFGAVLYFLFGSRKHG